MCNAGSDTSTIYWTVSFRSIEFTVTSVLSTAGRCDTSGTNCVSAVECTSAVITQ